MAQRFNGFAALGDSFTEGMNDHYVDGSLRGWADLVAAQLAKSYSGLTYANLAVRGRLFDQVVDEQVPAALRLRPDLVSFVAGGNDALRSGFNPAKLGTRLHEVVRVLTASDAKVILFTFSAGARVPGQRMLQSRLAGVNEAVRRVAKRHRASLVDLWSDEAFADERLWSVDRLHMSELGHKRVAGKVCAALDIDPDPDWKVDLAPVTRKSWVRRRGDDLTWTRHHLAPWVKRRIKGTSSGDTITAKRPLLTPVDLKED
ncbi:SGNH/GDSL hydrolase family protein [Stackebrandtia soli]|uniref:SGNH/GDSL hydrolase family protein n=1 Tax=Stackebrandtia soli TaxID=1892856 RepID=UPI0039EBFC81